MIQIKNWLLKQTFEVCKVRNLYSKAVFPSKIASNSFENRLKFAMIRLQVNGYTFAWMSFELCMHIPFHSIRIHRSRAYCQFGKSVCVRESEFVCDALAQLYTTTIIISIVVTVVNSGTKLAFMKMEHFQKWFNSKNSAGLAAVNVQWILNWMVTGVQVHGYCWPNCQFNEAD